MTFYEIALARTKKGKLELVVIECETFCRMTKPTKHAEKLLEKYASRRNLSRALTLQRHLSALTKFAPVGTWVCGRK